MNNNTKTKIAIGLNLTVFFCEIYAIIKAFTFDKLTFFQYYTQDSNTLLAIFCLIYAILSIICLTKKEENIPQWVYIAKYIVTCLITVTFLVVVFILTPTTEGTIGKKLYRMFWFKSTFFMHLICPVLAIISFLFFENNYKLKFSYTALALIPTLLYALITITLNAVRVMDGPYFFLRVHQRSIFMSIVWCVVVLGFAYLIALGIWAIKKITNKN